MAGENVATLDENDVFVKSMYRIFYGFVHGALPAFLVITRDISTRGIM